MIGVGLISLGVVCDALTSNLEEKVFFRTAEPSSHAEVIFYSSLIGIAYGYVHHPLTHASHHPQSPPARLAFHLSLCRKYFRLTRRVHGRMATVRTSPGG